MSGTTSRLIRFISRAAVVLLSLQIILLISGPPRGVAAWLDRTDLKPFPHPRYVVVLGGGGIPSGSTLTRCYHAAQFGLGMTGTTFVVSLPTDSAPETSSVGRMRDELVMRGIPGAAILMEYRGLNSRQQAANIRKLLGDAATNETVLVVTSDLHMRRAILCFQKAGFNNVTGLVSYETSAEADSGPWTWFRYRVWSNGISSIRILRELIAVLVCNIT